MNLERSIALVFLLVCIAYGYSAFTTMQAGLLPFELNMAFLPNTLPKGLAVLGALLALCILLAPGNKQSAADVGSGLEADKIGQYKVGQAIALLAMMVAYALLLRPAGFLLSTFVFLFGGAFILGERRWVIMLASAGLGSFVVWFLVQQMLGVYMRPLPGFF